VILGDIDQHWTDPQSDIGRTGIWNRFRFGSGPVTTSQKQSRSCQPG